MPERVLGRQQPIRGVVHDERSYMLNGVAGHAGIFSTVSDMRIVCQMLVDNGQHNGKKYLSSKTLGLALTNWNKSVSTKK